MNRHLLIYTSCVVLLLFVFVYAKSRNRHKNYGIVSGVNGGTGVIGGAGAGRSLTFKEQQEYCESKGKHLYADGAHDDTECWQLLLEKIQADGSGLVLEHGKNYKLNAAETPESKP